MLGLGALGVGVRTLKALKELSRPQLRSATPEDEPLVVSLKYRQRPGETATPESVVDMDKAAGLDEETWSRGVNAIRENVIDPLEKNVPLMGNLVVNPPAKPWALPLFMTAVPAAGYSSWRLADWLVKREKQRRREQEMATAKNDYADALAENYAAKQASADFNLSQSLSAVAQDFCENNGQKCAAAGTWLLPASVSRGLQKIRDAVTNTINTTRNAAAKTVDTITNTPEYVTEGVSNAAAAAVKPFAPLIQKIPDAAQAVGDAYHGLIIGPSLSLGLGSAYLAHRFAYDHARKADRRWAFNKALLLREREQAHRSPKPVTLSIDDEEMAGDL